MPAMTEPVGVLYARLPHMEIEGGITERDRACAAWEAGWICLRTEDLTHEDETWSAAAARIFEDQEVALIEPPSVVDGSGEWMPDDFITGDPDQFAKVSCWVKAAE